jgi:hypothetical protein
VTVVAHEEVALNEVAEHGVKVKRTHFTVADELVLDRALDLVHDDLHAVSCRVVDGRSIREDMINELIVLQGEQNLITPVGISCRGRIKNNRDKRVNVLYPQACAWSMALMVASPPESGGDVVLEEEALVGASFRVAAAASAPRVAAEACSSSKRRVMARTRV